MCRRPLVPFVLSLALAAPAFGQHPAAPEDAHRLHSDPVAYRAALDDPAREAWQKPHEVIVALALRDGEVVADIGAGSGYFTFRFARHVGQRGRVYAVDVSADMIRAISGRASSPSEGVPRPGSVAPILATPDDPLLPAASVDTVFICDTWHHVENRVAYATKLKSALLPGGRVVIVDFHKGALPVGPPPSMKLAREEVIAEFEKAGYSVSKEHTFLRHQYFIEFTPLAR